MKKSTAVLSMLSILVTPCLAISAESSKGLDIPGDFSASITLTSEYSFRGVTQSDENPSIQGSLDWSNEFEDGFGTYLGVWASNVDFNDNDEANSEFDFYGGVTYEVDAWSFDIGGIYYVYPGAADALDYDFFEFQAAVGYDFDVASLSVSMNYTPENFGNSGDAQYYKLAGEVPLPHEFTLSAHIGRQNINDNAVFGLPDYTDWSIGLSYDIENINISVHYIDTDINKNNCADGCDGRIILGISSSF